MNADVLSNAERDLLAIALLGQMERVAATGLQPSHFTTPPRANVWAKMLELAAKGEPVNAHVVPELGDEHTQQGLLEAVAQVPLSLDVESTSRAVQREARNRQIRKLAGAIFESEEPTDEELDRLRSLLEPEPSGGGIDFAVTRGDEVADPAQVPWLWRGWLARGMLHLLAGQPSGGKSVLSSKLVADLTRARLDANEPVRVGWVSLDHEPQERIVGRVCAAGGDREVLFLLGNVETSKGPEPWTLAQIEPLRRAIETHKLGLVVVDPVGYGLKGDGNEYASVGGQLSRLAELAESTGAAILAISHSRKGGSHDSLEAAIGSVAFVGVPRSVWVAGKDRSELDGPRLLAVVKPISTVPPALGYRIVDSGLPGEIPVIRDLVEIEGKSAEDVTRPVEPPDRAERRSEAGRWLVAFLSGGPRPKAEIVEAGEREGYAARTLQRASKELGLTIQDHGRAGSTWALPGQVIAPTFIAPTRSPGTGANSSLVRGHKSFIAPTQRDWRELGATSESISSDTAHGTINGEGGQIPEPGTEDFDATEAVPVMEPETLEEPETFDDWEPWRGRRVANEPDSAIVPLSAYLPQQRKQRYA